jgi:hypothetical protein
MKLLRVFSTTLLLLLTLSIAMVSQSHAATMFTDGAAGNSDIIDAANWDNGLPDNVGNAGTIPTGFNTAAGGTGGGANVDDLDGMVLTFEGNSTLVTTNNRSDDNILTFNGTSNWTNDATLFLGRDGPAGTSTTVNINDSASLATIPRLTNMAGGKMGIGRIGNAFIVQSGGSVTIDDEIEIGAGNGGSGLYTLSAGTVLAEFLEFDNVTPGVTSSFDFTVGSTGVLTLRNGGADYSADLLAFIVGGDITVGAAAATAADFLITIDTGVSTSIRLIPEPSSLALVGLTIGMTVSLLHRRM